MMTQLVTDEVGNGGIVWRTCGLIEKDPALVRTVKSPRQRYIAAAGFSDCLPEKSNLRRRVLSSQRLKLLRPGAVRIVEQRLHALHDDIVRDYRRRRRGGTHCARRQQTRQPGRTLESGGSPADSTA